jgi:hypothetical protein
MKLLARVVKVDSPTGRKEDYVYSETGFGRELQILNDENQVIWKSGSNHPQSNIYTVFNGFHFMTPKESFDVYVKLEDGIEFNR